MNEKKNILIIEDDFEIRSSIIDILENNNYSVVSAADGKSAMNITKQVKPDLIICDIMLPGINGYEILDNLKNIIAEELIPFIYLSAKVDPFDVRKGMNLGADDYITKPFRAQDLLEAVDTRLKKSENLKKHLQKGSHAKQNKLEKEQGIMITDNIKTEFVKVKNILCISALGDYCKVYLKNSKKLLSSKSLKDWESILPDDLFYRTHRSYIVNINHIEEVKPWFKRSYKIKMKNLNEDIFISERHAVKFKKIINI